MKQYGIYLLIALCVIIAKNQCIATPDVIEIINYRVSVRAADQVKLIFQSTLKAANQGNVSALYYIGKFYFNGTGINRDYIQAFKWLDLAATVAGPQQRADELRDAAGRQLTPQQIAQTRKLAMDWRTAHPHSPNYYGPRRDNGSSQNIPTYYKLGKDINAPIPLIQPLPLYTAEAFDEGFQGMVLLECMVRKNGTVGSVGVRWRGGYGLDEAAIAAISQWHFRPGCIKGIAADIGVTIGVSFSLGQSHSAVK